MIKINYIYIHYTRSNFTTMKFLITSDHNFQYCYICAPRDFACRRLRVGFIKILTRT